MDILRDMDGWRLRLTNFVIAFSMQAKCCASIVARGFSVQVTIPGGYTESLPAGWSCILHQASPRRPKLISVLQAFGSAILPPSRAL